MVATQQRTAILALDPMAIDAIVGRGGFQMLPLDNSAVNSAYAELSRKSCIVDW